MTINAALQSLAADLAAEGIADPLAEPFTLAALWHDLCQLTGESLPTDVAALLDSPHPIRPVLAAPKPTRRVCAVVPCEACGQPVGADGYRDAEACIALCGECAEADREYARDVLRLAR